MLLRVQKKGETKMINVEKSRQPVIVAAARTPVGKAKRGSLATTRPEDMMATVIKDLYSGNFFEKPCRVYSKYFIGVV